MTRHTRTATEEEGLKGEGASVAVPSSAQSSGHKRTRPGPAPAGQGSVNSGHLTEATCRIIKHAPGLVNITHNNVTGAGAGAVAVSH